MRRIAHAAVLWASLLSVSGSAQAQLTSLGTVVYDDVLDITWLADANLAQTSTFGVSGINADGSMSWTTAQSWIAALNKMNWGGSNQWALPTTVYPDDTCNQGPGTTEKQSTASAKAAFGYSCTGSQLGFLYYQRLGGTEGSTIILTHDSSYGKFNNFQPYLYWSATAWPKVPNSYFSFSFGNGWQGTDIETNALYVIAVHPGPVEIFPFPKGPFPPRSPNGPFPAR
jgi:hypothetical protein